MTLDQRLGRGEGGSCGELEGRPPAEAGGESFDGIAGMVGKGRWRGVNWGLRVGNDLREAMERQSVGAIRGFEQKNGKS